jgi:catechol 2,3-dioxygenase-like lactoylglutathione lyase family enzyme
MAFDYIMIGSNDLARSRRFYDAVMAQLGATLAHDYEGITFAYRMTNGVTIWIGRPYDKQDARPGNGIMPGFGCSSPDAVDTAHAAALAAGGSNEGDPGPRPLYGPGIYVGYVRDPDGNKMSFIHNDARSA